MAQDLIKKCQDQNKAFYLVIIDIDDFKQINDQYGHVVGDQVIQSVVNTLIRNTTQAQFLGRIGGEEFILLLPQMNAEQASQITEQARQAVADRPIDLGDSTIAVTISGGMAGGAPINQSLQALMTRADEALYQAKASGKNRIITAGGTA